MGAEAKCRVRFNAKTSTGQARLETDVLQFRGGDLRLSIPFKDLSKIGSRASRLTVTFHNGTASFDLGPAAAKWADKIRNPSSRLDKLGAKPDWRASALGVHDQTFLNELETAVSLLSIGRVIRENDAIFFGANRSAELTRLALLKASLKPTGALWVIRPRGRPEISEQSVMATGKAAGLVDVKVVSFSATHTAEKFVIPVKDRPR